MSGMPEQVVVKSQPSARAHSTSLSTLQLRAVPEHTGEAPPLPPTPPVGDPPNPAVPPDAPLAAAPAAPPAPPASPSELEHPARHMTKDTIAAETHFMPRPRGGFVIPGCCVRHRGVSIEIYRADAFSFHLSPRSSHRHPRLSDLVVEDQVRALQGSSYSFCRNTSVAARGMASQSHLRTCVVPARTTQRQVIRAAAHRAPRRCDPSAQCVKACRFRPAKVHA